MATLLNANHTPVPCAPLPSRPAAAQRPATPATPPSDFLRELHSMLSALGQR
ncbi:MAG TPA: hypothetical protein VJ752_13590 [Burkholderiaceae bacterium]|nr:hypothetical protein [Burkholderiaceae bacterium]